jgi:hypothetical protein
LSVLPQFLPPGGEQSAGDGVVNALSKGNVEVPALLLLVLMPLLALGIALAWPGPLSEPG